MSTAIKWLNIRVHPLNAWRNCHWCKRTDANYAVERQSALTGNYYTDNACAGCAAEWIEAAGGVSE